MRVSEVTDYGCVAAPESDQIAALLVACLKDAFPIIQNCDSIPKLKVWRDA